WQAFQALMGVKASLKDPHSVLENWDQDSVDPCSWTMVTCSPENLVIGLLLQNNNISGPIPQEIGRLSKLRTLDLSNNYFTGGIPTSITRLKQHDEEVCLGNLKKFQFRELQIATDNFSSKNILGKGGFGIVYKGHLKDGTLVAVKRLKDGSAVGGEIQFQTEVEMISLAVHRNLLRLHGFLGAARGLLYLHEQCDPKIIHRDVKAANILLDDYCEAINDIRLKNLSLFYVPLLFVYLITQVKKIHQEKKLDMLMDKSLKNIYDRIELEEMVQVALLCTQFLPGHRPKMSEVVRMLEGDGLVERWEASQRVDSQNFKVPEFAFSERCYSNLTDDSSLLVQAVELSGPR
ncbi:hypothetical protein B296_00041751, partial [Ensete ventricosum]